MQQWKIGCSGYHYIDWKRIFYPENIAQKKWFEYYSEHFNSLELNVTFYRFPRLHFLQGWFKRSPDNFSFSVKAPRLITHYKKLNEAQEALHNFYDVARNGLQHKLGSVLFQFPSSFVFEEHRLERIINLLDHSMQNVVEFRHESWWQQKVFDAFAQNNITFCGISHPQLSDKVIKTSDIVYYRFHGVPHLYSSRYDIQDLERVASEIQSMEGVRESFIYFNNTAEATAVINAKQFQELCEVVSK
ncbi:DUF72 domain-containing protein [Chryseosolibacter indicus]|uniref:DUF72 domain-containing protein n=1 Tax=Chryseosolibacter indicus TaxID=2782351 RepID=A0ABS5VUK5_9BACT|nr:DUF72 domain-containing protein [Chryseosolibacter indicus]MBT1705115.1 DUF72 domain-containing protein [Chryseosolibacter indicus]